MAACREIPLLPFTSPEVVESALDFRSPFDPSLPTLFIATYPKSGTHWCSSIVYHILLRSKKSCDADMPPLKHISDYVSFFDHPSAWSNKTLAPQYLETHKELGRHVFMTHFLPPMLPLRDPEASRTKVIYAYRNAADVVTSQYHHLANMIFRMPPSASTETSSSSPSPEMNSQHPIPSFAEFVASFCSGSIFYGSWMEHILDWFSTSLGESILFLQYEDLLARPEENISKVAQFLGVDLSAEQVQYVVSQTSFSRMSKDVDLYQPIAVDWKPGFRFIRSGKKGDESLFGGEEASEARRRLDEFIQECIEKVKSRPFNDEASRQRMLQLLSQ